MHERIGFSTDFLIVLAKYIFKKNIFEQDKQLRGTAIRTKMAPPIFIGDLKEKLSKDCE